GTCGLRPRSPYTGRMRSGSTSAVEEASATCVEIFIADHRPETRDMSAAWTPKSRTSWEAAGYRVGMDRSGSASSDAQGRDDDFAAGSSPTRATAPPCGSVPIRLACRRASQALSRPGALPYQRSEERRVGKECRSRGAPEREESKREEMVADERERSAQREE